MASAADLTSACEPSPTAPRQVPRHGRMWRAGSAFVERKVSNAVAPIKLGLRDSVTLGNLDVVAGLGLRRDYVEAMWRMLQQDEPHGYVIASGETHIIRDLLDAAFMAIDIVNWKPYVRQTARRPRAWPRRARSARRHARSSTGIRRLRRARLARRANPSHGRRHGRPQGRCRARPSTVT